MTDGVSSRLLWSSGGLGEIEVSEKAGIYICPSSVAERKKHGC
jgi:hypothetical protein